VQRDHRRKLQAQLGKAPEVEIPAVQIVDVNQIWPFWKVSEKMRRSRKVEIFDASQQIDGTYRLP
jgi:hypothetical protein